MTNSNVLLYLSKELNQAQHNKPQHKLHYNKIHWSLSETKQALTKVIWEEPHGKVPIGYNGMPQIHPQNSLFPSDDHDPHLIHPHLNHSH